MTRYFNNFWIALFISLCNIFYKLCTFYKTNNTKMLISILKIKKTLKHLKQKASISTCNETLYALHVTLNSPSFNTFIEVVISTIWFLKGTFYLNTFIRIISAYSRGDFPPKCLNVNRCLISHRFRKLYKK